MNLHNILHEGREAKIHIAQIVLTVFVIGMAIGRMCITSPPPSRINVVPITFGFKTLAIITYQLLTTHRSRFVRYKSLKAYAILNCLECVFWFAVIVLSAMSLRGSYGSAAAMSVLVVLLSIVLLFLAIWTAIVSVRQRRREKGLGKEQV